jgi:hypothetical protein
MFKQFQPIDLLALVVVAGSLVLIQLGHFNEVAIPLTAVIGFYFGHKGLGGPSS